MIIDRFEGEYAFLSNFYNTPVTFEGFTYRNSEAAFQAQKCPSRAKEFIDLPPNEAKRLGRRVQLRKDWEQIKDAIMYLIVSSKFEQNSDLKRKLLDTEMATLIEGNTWNDKYWGVCNDEGLNKLGNILMSVRDELRNQ